MAPVDREKKISRDPRVASRDRREAEQDRLRLAAMGIEGGGESPARLTPPPVRPIIRIISDVQLAPPTAGTTDVPTTPGDEDNQARFGAQSPAPTTAPARPAGDAGETATRGRDRARAPRGSTDADRGSRDRADGSLPRGSGSAPLGCAVADRGSRDRAARSLSRGSGSAPLGCADDADRGSRDRASANLSRDSDSAPRGGAAADRGSRDRAETPCLVTGMARPRAAPVSRTPALTPPPSKIKTKGKPMAKNHRQRHLATAEANHGGLQKQIPTRKKTPEKKTVKPPSPQRPGAPQNSPTTPVSIPTLRRSDEPSYPTHQMPPKPQRPPRKLEVDVSSGAASRDSSVASIASMDSGPKDVKNRVKKAKSPASHPPAFSSATSGQRGKKRVQEDEPEFKQPATMPRYSTLTTPPQTTSYALATSAVAAPTATATTSNASKPQRGRKARRARKPRRTQQPNKEATQPGTSTAVVGETVETQKGTTKDSVVPRPNREQPSTCAGADISTSLPMPGTTHLKTKQPEDTTVAARTGTKAKPESTVTEDAAPKGLTGIIIDGILKLASELKRALEAGESLIPVLLRERTRAASSSTQKKKEKDNYYDVPQKE
ncbi:hypothetical protein ACJJTC_006663 [Scirpophaga incertulas]